VRCTPYQVKEDMENHRKSHIKKKRKSGFRARMKTYGGRIVLGNKRRANKHAKAKHRKAAK
jgi:ribosomal protein L34